MTLDTALTDPDPATEITYAYKPSMLGAPWEFRLQADALEWQKGRVFGRIPYAEIRRVRLSYRPMTLQNHRFIAEIWAPQAPRLDVASSSWRSLVEQERFDQPYSSFIRELHLRMSQVGTKASLETGSPPFLYWPGVVVFGGAALALAALTVRALQESAWGAAAVVGAFFGLFLWQTGQFFKRNYPARYSPDAIPDRVLPR